jgi:hypothetical protein
MRIRELVVLDLTLLIPLAWLLFGITVIWRGRICRCPKCGSKRTRRSWPRMFDHLLPAFIVARRCESCQKRFYNLESANYRRSSAPASMPRPARRPKLARSA